MTPKKRLPYSAMQVTEVKGLGAALLQKGKPIAYASRSLPDTMTRYAQIEKAIFTIVFSLDQ